MTPEEAIHSPGPVVMCAGAAQSYFAFNTTDILSL